MTPEERSLLEKTARLAEENNSILRSMRRSSRWGTAFRVLYYTVIIGLGVGSYYFIQPYVEQVSSLYSGAQGALNVFQ